MYKRQIQHIAAETGVAIMSAPCDTYAAAKLISQCAPIVSFHYGARNHAEVHNLYQKSLRLIAVVSVRCV